MEVRRKYKQPHSQFYARGSTAKETDKDKGHVVRLKAGVLVALRGSGLVTSTIPVEGVGNRGHHYQEGQ